MKNDELKPCPFCGGKAEVFFNKANELWYVCCYDEYNDFDCCEINTTWYSKKEDAIEAWNTRTEPKAITKEQDVCTIAGMDNQKCHAFNGGDCMNAFQCKAPVGKIREAFELTHMSCDYTLDEWRAGLEHYSEGCKFQQAEIERLEKKIPIVSVDRSKLCFDGKGYTEDEQIERLKAENEALRCCGNCSIGPIKGPYSRCRHCTDFSEWSLKGKNLR